MNLIIEAGGTKSNLSFVEGGKILASYTGPGIQLSSETVEDFEKKSILWSDLPTNPVQSIFLFVAGKADAKKEQALQQILLRTFQATEVHIQSDLLAACYATAGNHSGIVGILGTGSNSCYYNGKEIEKNLSPGGFILGDEGSGAYLGKQLLIDYLRLNLPETLRKELHQEFELNEAFILQNVYGGTIKSAAAFCSSFAPFIIHRLQDEYCADLCQKGIEAYLQLIQKNYADKSNRLYLVGSIAHYLQDKLMATALRKNIEIIKIIQHPIQDLSLFLCSR
jgi:N-acetylglucosamine kinase-like BadF-type ATPase